MNNSTYQRHVYQIADARNGSKVDGGFGWEAATWRLISATVLVRADCGGSMPEYTDALDAMTAAPDHHEVILENDHVRVLDTRLRPGEQTPIHSHCWPSSLYVMSWSNFVRRDANGNIIVDSREWASRPEPGEALWSEPLVPHSVENVGDRELRIIAVELKQART